MKYLGTKELETERLFLRRATKEDSVEAYNNWCNSDIVDKYVLWKQHESQEVTFNLYSEWEKQYEEPTTFRWIVGLKDTNELIGTIDVSKKFLKFGTCEIGYCYGEKFWNKGYATEALKAVIKYLFEECDAELVCAEFMDNNPASGKVMAKAGLKYEGLLRSRVIDKLNRRNDLLSYSITKEEYFNQL